MSPYNTPTGAQDKIAATITANAGVKHWIIWGCNDENVQGGVTAMENAGISADNVIGVGLGAYLACKDWSGSKPSGMKAALFINGKDVGALAVQTMYDKLKNSKDFPKEGFAPQHDGQPVVPHIPKVTSVSTVHDRATSAQALALRARIVLACDGLDVPSIVAVARELGITADTVRKWRRRFLAERLDGLVDEPRPGRPPSIAVDEVHPRHRPAT
ncbi:helix-turn-helix domain-containing protein [Kitasatospora sp. NBC_00240]|uniref:helix-turn-helix domain-containing protein n=1 Tax=Kitasatospora sp. NBC_00240 TaxID=2903567 RepID=UPI00224EC9AB|nr:helix-turn-helix domain-containing protein [Kitasatospora sp. NBC_00240]MCX5215164.1 helix-turn-helix domain-containing protein [Kitasatospora sp. NBC_00240]